MSNEVKNLEEMYLHGEYKKILDVTDKILSRDAELDQKNSILMWKARALTYLGEIKASNEIIEKLNSEKLNPELKINWYICRAMNLFYQGKYKEEIELLHECEKKYSGKMDDTLEIQNKYSQVLTFLGGAYIFQRNLPKSLEYYSKSLELSKEIKFQELIGRSLFGFSMYFRAKGEFEEGLKYAKKSLKIFKKIDLKEGLIYNWCQLDVFYSAKGDYAKALDYNTKALKLATEIGLAWGILVAQGNRAYRFLYSGNLVESLELFQKSAKLYEKLDNLPMRATYLAGIAQIYYYKGDFDASLENLELSNALFEKIQYLIGIAFNTYLMGDIHAYLDDVKKSQSYYEKALKFYKTYPRPDFLAIVYSDLIKLYVDQGNIETAKSYLIELEDYLKDTENIVVDQIMKYIHALVLKSSKRLKDIATAQQLLKEIIDSDDLRYDIRFATLLTLCELYLIELEFSSDPSIFNELLNLIEKMELIADGANSQILLINILTLKGKLALVSEGSQKALEIFEKALKLSDLKGLDLLSQEIQQEKENIQQDVEKWVDIIVSNMPMKEKLSLVNLKEYIRDTIQIVHTNKWTYEPKHQAKCTVFISYAVADSEKFNVREVARELEMRDKINQVYCWELWDGYPDGSIIKFMETGIRDSQIFLPFFSKSYNDSINCQKEYEAALAVNKTLIPIFQDFEQVPVLCRAKIGLDVGKYDHEGIVEELYKFIMAELSRELDM